MVDVQRLARGLVDECSRTGGASRYLDSTTDALVVRALAQAQARRRHLPVRVGLTDGHVVATLDGAAEVRPEPGAYGVGDTGLEPVTPAV